MEKQDIDSKVELKWYGHSGFKISFNDLEGVNRCIYIDIWKDNKDCKDTECPTDCDLALVSSGSFEHSLYSPFLISAGSKPNRQIVTSEEISTYYHLFRRLDTKFVFEMQCGGSHDFGYVKIRMVTAQHSSTCPGP